MDEQPNKLRTSLVGIEQRMSKEQGRFVWHCKTLPIS